MAHVSRHDVASPARSERAALDLSSMDVYKQAAAADEEELSAKPPPLSVTLYDFDEGGLGWLIL